MACYRDLLFEPKGHHRVVLLSVDGTEGPAACEALHEALSDALQRLAEQGPGLPFGVVCHLRACPPLPGVGFGELASARTRLYLRSVQQLARGGMTLLATVAEGQSGEARLAGARFSAGSWLGGQFAGLDEAYRWLESRLAPRRSRSLSGI